MAEWKVEGRMMEDVVAEDEDEDDWQCWVM